MATSPTLTIVDCILAAAATLDKQQGKFSAEDLVVQAWRMFPSRFSLQGHPDHPDSNRVLTKIMGASSPLRSKGWIERIGTKQYRLTQEGRMASMKIAGGQQEQRLSEIPRSFVPELRRMMESAAYEKSKRDQAFAFSDASEFWNISARSTANQFNTRVENSEGALRAALAVVADRKQVRLPGTAIDVERAELEALQKVSNDLKIAFAADIAVITRRTNERYS